MMGWIVRIALETGMRWSEILTLRESQVDLKRRIVRLLKTKNTQPRTVPLTLSAVEMFSKAIENPVRPDDTDLIFLEHLAEMVFGDLINSIGCGRQSSANKV
jgi:integrase